MMKFKTNKSQALLTIIALIFSLFIVHFTFYIPAALAADSSPSADIKAKLEEFRKEAASKGAQLKELISKRLQNKAYAGMVKSISDQSITVATKSGPKIISINQDTVYESKLKSKTKFSFKALAKEDYIAGLGDVDETGVLIAKKIVLLNPTPNTLNLKTYLWGKVVSISDDLSTIKDKDNKYISVTFPEKPAVKINDFVILSGKRKEASPSSNINQVFNAGFVYTIPQAILKPKKVATPSAKIATPSAKPTGQASFRTK